MLEVWVSTLDFVQRISSSKAITTSNLGGRVFESTNEIRGIVNIANLRGASGGRHSGWRRKKGDGGGSDDSGGKTPRVKTDVVGDVAILRGCSLC